MRRDDRLIQEYRKLRELTQQSSFISFRTTGSVPDRYTVTFTCAGLAVNDGIIVMRMEHICTIFLHSAFPHQHPRITWRTPIFHPNFRESRVCLGDAWTTGRTIAQLCLDLGEMIQYKNLNIVDPLDPVAAAWAARVQKQIPHAFPVDDRNLLAPKVSLEMRQSALNINFGQQEGELNMPAGDDDILILMPFGS